MRFIGSAHEALKNVDIPKNGLSVRISSCDVTNKYDPETKKVYTNYAIFGIEIQDGYGTDKSGDNKKSARSAPKTSDSNDKQTTVDDNELPF